MCFIPTHCTPCKLAVIHHDHEPTLGSVCHPVYRSPTREFTRCRHANYKPRPRSNLVLQPKATIWLSITEQCNLKEETEQLETERESDRQTDRERERETEKERERESQAWTQTDRQTDRQRDRKTHREWEGQRERERERERERLILNALS